MAVTLPIRMTDRRWAVDDGSDNLYGQVNTFDGTVLVIEIKSPAEVAEVETAINAQIDAEKWFAEHGDQL